MTLELLCRRTISLQRALVTPGSAGDVTRQWQTIAANIPAAILPIRGRDDLRLNRRGLSITHAVMLAQNIGAQLGDRIFDSTSYYQVQYIDNLGDRDQTWVIYTRLLLPQDVAPPIAS
ncbi:MAG TPA: head-tail adaptor protein [Phycisphaerae bacterium]|nr:head-tail adaptor protein [Phycisphaerae bacterium]